MHTIDYILVGLYLVLLLSLGIYKRLRPDSSASELVVGGRTLTLPAFVASLVSTWYGGILGVGEFSFNYGVSNWLVFGLPYYLAAALFALFLAKKARESKLLTIPERLAECYGNRTALAGSVVIFVMTVPAAYVLALGVLCQQLFGLPFWVGLVGGTLFSVVYVYFGGFNSVIRTDLFQFWLMFVGFAVLLATVVTDNGGLGYLVERLPADHLTWHGGNSGWYVAVWYVIALATLVEPAFFQRCYAAGTAKTARKGILISIAFWAMFDFMTTACGLYARALLPDLAEPVAAYPALAQAVLPAGLLGLFVLALLATVMSTVDSYSFLAATTFGNDIMARFRKLTDVDINRYSRLGLVLSAGLAVALAGMFRSVVDIWHDFGSIGVPILLVPVFFSFVGKRRLSSGAALFCMLLSGGVALAWYAAGKLNSAGVYPFGIEPIFPGLLCSIVVYLSAARAVERPLPRS